VLLSVRFFSTVKQVLVETFAAARICHSLAQEKSAQFPVHRHWRFNVVALMFVQFLQKVGNCEDFQ